MKIAASERLPAAVDCDLLEIFDNHLRAVKICYNKTVLATKTINRYFLIAPL